MLSLFSLWAMFRAGYGELCLLLEGDKLHSANIVPSIIGGERGADIGESISGLPLNKNNR